MPRIPANACTAENFGVLTHTRSSRNDVFRRRYRGSGFSHGGWIMKYGDEEVGRAVLDTVAEDFDLLLGRRTYEIFAGYWPSHGDNPIGKAFNRAVKYVATRTLERLDWENSRRVEGDVVEAVRRLKSSPRPSGGEGAGGEGKVRIEKGKDGLELGTYFHPGGHEYPRDGGRMAIDFFRRHARP